MTKKRVLNELYQIFLILKCQTPGLIPGAISDETSALSDCFQDDLLSPPIYTRPADFNGWKVPDILLCGDPKKIQAWQDEQALERTKRLRPNLLEK